jgi:competence protein ComEC
MRFFHYPFVFITLSFLLGVILAFHFIPQASLTFSTAIVILILAFIFFLFRVKGLSFIVVACCLFCAIGCLHILMRLRVMEGNSFQSTYNSGDISVVRIFEAKEGKGDWHKAIGEVLRLVGISSRIVRPEKVLLLIHKSELLPHVGDHVAIISALLPIQNKGNPGEFDAEAFWSRQGVRYMSFVSKGEILLLNRSEQNPILHWIASSRDYLKSILVKHLTGPERAISLALILGDNSLLDQEIRNSFTNTGALHVLAVSGLHISIIMQIIMVVLSLFSSVLSRRTALILLIGIMWWYAAITGLSPSVLRAVFMFTVLSVAQLSGRNYHPINTLLFTAFILVLWDPFTVFDIGFQLSFLAMLGIYLFYENIESFWPMQQPILQKVWQGTAIGLAAQVMTTPLSLYYFNQFPNYFILTNIGLMASSGLILGGGLLIFTFSWWWLAAKWIGFALLLVVGVSLWFIEWVEKLPGAVAFGFTPSLWMVLIMGVLFPVLFKLSVSQKGFWMTGMLIILLLCGVVFQRLQNINRNEIVVFNERMVIVAVRLDRHILCFYRSRKSDFHKVVGCIDNYTKIHPGERHYFNLEKKNWLIKLGGREVSVARELGSIRISTSKKSVRILMTNQSKETIKEKYILAMPWVKNTSKISIDYFLAKGAWRIGI